MEMGGVCALPVCPRSTSGHRSPVPLSTWIWPPGWQPFPGRPGHVILQRAGNISPVGTAALRTTGIVLSAAVQVGQANRMNAPAGYCIQHRIIIGQALRMDEVGMPIDDIKRQETGKVISSSCLPPSSSGLGTGLPRALPRGVAQPLYRRCLCAPAGAAARRYIITGAGCSAYQ
jgi:hypothetical protein